MPGVLQPKAGSSSVRARALRVGGATKPEDAVFNLGSLIFVSKGKA